MNVVPLGSTSAAAFMEFADLAKACKSALKPQRTYRGTETLNLAESCEILKLTTANMRQSGNHHQHT